MRDSILLLGGNGFLGTHLAASLANDFDVRIFDRPGSTHHGVGRFFPGEIESAADLDAAMDGTSSLIYLVHETGTSPYLDSDRLALVRNIELLLLALESAERCGVHNIAFFSSGGAVYGIPSALPVKESHPIRPVSTYGVAKASMELYLQSCAHLKRFRTLILRPSNPFGPGQNPLRKQGVISVFAQKILHDEPIQIWGDGKARKDYIYVKDMADAIASLLRAGFDNCAYNVASGIGLSLLDVVAQIEAATGKSAKIQFKPARASDVPEIILDTTLMRQRTGFEHLTPLAVGIQETVTWLQTQFANSVSSV